MIERKGKYNSFFISFTTKSWFSYPNMTTPNSSMSESIPKMNMLIVSSGEELILLRMRRESPNLIYMASDDFLEVQLKGALKNWIFCWS